MIIIILKDKDSHEISTIVHSLKDKGLKVGVDFDFEYSSGKFDWNTMINIPRQTKFTFYNEKEGTWFALKWS